MGTQYLKSEYRGKSRRQCLELNYAISVQIFNARKAQAE
jgi:hypothetical protein